MILILIPLHYGTSTMGALGEKMDILHLIDRLEELFNESRTVFLTRNVMVNEEKMLDLIDQMRLSVPEEIKSAQQILNQKERVIAQAHEEANRTLALAREKSTELIEKDKIVEAAKIRAADIKRQAQEDCKVIKEEADEYALETLKKLENEIQQILNQVRNGIQTLKEDFNLQERVTQSDQRPLEG